MSVLPILSIALGDCSAMIGVGKSADVAELVDALDLGSSTFGVRVRVSASAF
jgi:hypothetical protein